MLAEQRVIDQLELLSEAERRQLLEEWNKTEADYPKEKCVHELFEEQVERSPEAVALVQEEQSLTYGELNARSNRLARHLRDLGVEPDARVAICMERGVEMVVALLATLKAGGAYVPLDPSYPPERLAYMLEDSAPAVLLTHGAAPVKRSSAPLTLNLENDMWQWAGQSELNPDRASIGLDARNLAYIIYTSGSTGVPKGASLTHHGLVNLAEAQRRAFRVGTHSHVIQFASPSFDASVSEIFVTLIAGATLFLPVPTNTTSGPDLIRLVRDKRITVMTIPPSVLSTLPEESLPELRTLVVAGEACSAELARIWKKGRYLVNAYGPTETTVCATMTECSHREGEPPIGKPIANTRVYLVDARMNPVPINVMGELYIAGVGLARGYLNRAGQTAERFLPDTFCLQPGMRIYKTGDLGRWLPGGEIEFLGRRDHQVKIRGFRIELGEIEARLAEHAAIKSAVALAHEDHHGDRRLVAYLVMRQISETAVDGEDGRNDRTRNKQIELWPSTPKEDETPIEQDNHNGSLAKSLRNHMGQYLPEYMTPSHFVVIEKLPLTPSGKVDRRALAQLRASPLESAAGYVAPRDETERVITGIWQEALGREKVGIDDNFFDLGGHSLLIVRIHYKLRERFKKDVPIVDLFKYPTVRLLAARFTGETQRSLTENIRGRARKQKEVANRKRPMRRSGGGKNGK
jgi:amino acid adenylation domain-containing protein